MANIDSREENNNFCAIQFDYFRGMEKGVICANRSIAFHSKL